MRKILKIGALLMCVLSFSLTLFACSSNETTDEVIPEGNIVLNIATVNLGFGIDWLKNLKVGFEAQNPNVTVKIFDSALEDKINMFLTQKNNNPYDLIFTEGSMVFRYAEKPYQIPGVERCYANLFDVYNAIPQGESMPIKDKLYDGIYDYFKSSDTEVYAIPSASTVFGLLYNSNVVSENELPKTTNELVELCKSIKKNKNKDAIIYAGVDTTYFEEIFELWWGQYEGKEQFYNYFYSDDINVLKQPGREKSLDVVSALINYNNGFVNKDSIGKKHISAQRDFIEGKAAFYPCGGWLENEMSELYPDGIPQINYMKTPVISSIVEKLEYRSNGNLMTDSMLSDVIEAIDNNETSFVGVSENDFNYIKSAREMYYYENLIDTVVIPSFSDNIEMAKKFLIYMYSNEGIENYNKANNGGSLPVYYDYSTLSANFSNMQKERLLIQGSHNNYIFRQRHGAIMSQDFYNTNIHTALGSINDSLTPKQIIDKTFNYYNANDQLEWNFLIGK